MQCEACEYENPREARFCVECGAGLGRGARKKAEGRFRDALETTRSKVADRLGRAGVKRRGALGDGSSDD